MLARTSDLSRSVGPLYQFIIGITIMLTAAVVARASRRSICCHSFDVSYCRILLYVRRFISRVAAADFYHFKSFPNVVIPSCTQAGLIRVLIFLGGLRLGRLQAKKIFEIHLLFKSSGRSLLISCLVAVHFFSALHWPRCLERKRERRSNTCARSNMKCTTVSDSKANVVWTVTVSPPLSEFIWICFCVPRFKHNFKCNIPKLLVRSTAYSLVSASNAPASSKSTVI